MIRIAIVDAEELLPSHKVKSFQIIFSDLEMPDVDGLHLAAELRKEDQHTLLIFVTNHDELVFQCFQYEVFNFIRKDFNYSCYHGDSPNYIFFMYVLHILLNLTDDCKSFMYFCVT